MTVDLSEYVASLRREVTPLGSTLFSAVTDEDLLPYLTDAFWEARLDGFMKGYVADEDGLIDPESGTTDLDQKYVALIVLYAGIRILRNQILNTNTQFRAKAGPVEFEQQSSATMLAEMLKQLRATKDSIIAEEDEIQNGYRANTVAMIDAFSSRLFSRGAYWGSRELA